MTATARPKRRPTYADIEALPPEVDGEILAGELVVTPRTAPPHTRTASVLGGLLIPPFDLGRGGPGGWWIDDEPELALGTDPDYDPVIPDLAGWRVDTMPEHPEGTAQYHVVPDWVCEVVSPKTARPDRVLKLPFYARSGVGHAWLVDPIARTLEVFRLEGGHYVLARTASEDDRVRAEPFDAVELDLSLLWQRRGDEDSDQGEGDGPDAG